MTPRILIYSFFCPRTISYRIVSSLSLPGIEKYYLGSLSSLLKHIQTNKYEYILGIVNFRKGTKSMRIEDRYVNRYGKKPILIYGKPELFSTWNIPESDSVIHVNSGTNGPCNRAAYMIASSLDVHQFPTRFTFIHIPKDFEFAAATNIITAWLKQIMS